MAIQPEVLLLLRIVFAILGFILFQMTSHQSEWLRSKIQEIAYAFEGVEKEEHSSIAGGLSSIYNHSGNQFGGSP